MSLCTSTQIKTHLGISGSTYDSMLAQMLLQVEKIIELETGIRTVATSYDTVSNEINSSEGGLQLRTKLRPIQTLTKIEYRDANRDWTTYSDETIGNVEFEDDKIYTKYVVAPEGQREVRISYTVGYKTADVPLTLNLLAILMTAGLFHERGLIGYTTQSVLGLSLTLKEDEHYQVKKILTMYKRVYAL